MKSKWSVTLQTKFWAVAIALFSILVMLSVIYYTRSLIFAPKVSKSGSDLITEFEGNYYMGDGLGVSCVFRINPDASFIIVWGTDTGHREEYEGSISIENMQFVLTSNKKVDEFAPCFYPTLIPLNWGDRRYLLPDDELSRYFCQDVKNGDEPRNRLLGYPYLRSTDINVPVMGYPRKVNGQLYCPPKQ